MVPRVVYHGRRAFGVDVPAAGFEPGRAIWWLVFLQLPKANQHAGVDYWRPVWKVLAAGLACACLALGANPSGVQVKLLL